MASIPKRNPQKLWMKKRSKDWWYNIVNNNNYDEFVQNFRVDKQTFLYLCNKWKFELQPDPRCVQEAISTEMKVAIALYKLASCSEYRVVANQFGVHKTTVHRCLKQFCAAVVKVLLPEEIKKPQLEDAKLISLKFREKSGVPQILGAIDGCHIPAKPPLEGYRDFISRKSWPSVILQGLVDANYLFLDGTVQHPGCTHDATVLKDSNLYKNFNNYPRDSKIVGEMEIKSFIIGDPAYPLQEWLIKGYVSPRSSEEESFNAYLNKARIVVENAFGRLKSRWRTLQKRIDTDIGMVSSVVATCCVLHNIVEKNKVTFFEHWNEDLQEMMRIFPQPQSRASDVYDKAPAHAIRNNLKNYMAQHFPLIERRF